MILTGISDMYWITRLSSIHDAFLLIFIIAGLVAVLTGIIVLSFSNDDEDDNCFYCPNCIEPIYEEDFDELESCVETGEIFCPICEISF